jgi:hypothetical protein
MNFPLKLIIVNIKEIAKRLAIPSPDSLLTVGETIEIRMAT